MTLKQLEEYTKAHLQNLSSLISNELQIISQVAPPEVQEQIRTTWNKFCEIQKQIEEEIKR